jgi:hypothetical protein
MFRKLMTIALLVTMTTTVQAGGSLPRVTGEFAQADGYYHVLVQAGHSKLDVWCNWEPEYNPNLVSKGIVLKPVCFGKPFHATPSPRITVLEAVAHKVPLTDNWVYDGIIVIPREKAIHFSCDLTQKRCIGIRPESE